MWINAKFVVLTKKGFLNFKAIYNSKYMRRYYHPIPFVDLYQQTTGQYVSNNFIENIKNKHPHINKLTHDQLQSTIKILDKFNISIFEACQDCHVFSMNPITVDNYGEILQECGFIKIIPKYLIRYHTLVRSRTITRLKMEGLMRNDINLVETLQNCFRDWPDSKKSKKIFSDQVTSILTVRMSVLEEYLIWRLSITKEVFQKYCRNYLPLKHKPFSDITEALYIAENDIKFDIASIQRNGFIVSSDPVNTKLIIENVESIAGLDIREAIRIEPAILKNNHKSLLKIRNLMEEYRISQEAQRRCLRVYCMCPETVQERLEELSNLKEYQVLSTNPRVLYMLVHKKKMLNRLTKIQAAKKQCYSLNHLISSSKVFNTYISSFGDKVCGKDIATLICTSLNNISVKEYETNNKDRLKEVLSQLRRHKYWLHAALGVIDQNIQFLKKKFTDKDILNNCHLLLYPLYEIEPHITHLLKIRSQKYVSSDSIQMDGNYNNLRREDITDSQILSLVLYEIEKKYHFSCDGIWTRQDGLRVENQC